MTEIERNTTLHFFSKEVDESYIRTLSPYFENDEESLKDRFRCRICMDGADTIDVSNPKNRFGWSVTFHCSHCNFMWFLCKKCNAGHQPELPKKSIRRMRIHDRREYIDQEIAKHDANHRHLVNTITVANEDLNIQHGFVGNDPFEEEESVIFDNNAILQSSVLSEIRLSSILQDEDNRLTAEKKDNIGYALLYRHLSGTYSPYLIKKYWVKNMSCQLINEDCLLFVEIVNELLRGSRDDNKRLMNLVGKTTTRCQQMLQITLNRVRELENALNKLSALHRQMLHFCNEMTGVDDMLRTSLSSFQSETSHILDDINNTVSGQCLNFANVSQSNGSAGTVVSYSIWQIS